MPDGQLYADLLAQLAAHAILSPDLPDETFETTLRALWLTAAGTPCSPRLAQTLPLPELTQTHQAALMILVERRIAGVLLAHITGRTNFMGLELHAAPGVLVPRAETEILGNAVVSAAREEYAGRSPLLIVEIGCGSGNLACGIAARIPEARMYAIDVAAECVELTRENADEYRLTERVTVLHGDLFLPLRGRGLEESVDLVVSNPPYIPSGKLASDHSHLVKSEPRAAFDGGPFGFSIHHRLINESLAFLRPRGSLLFEFGLGQDQQVRMLFSRSGGYEPVRFEADEAGRNRIARARRLPHKRRGRKCQVSIIRHQPVTDPAPRPSIRL